MESNQPIQFNPKEDKNVYECISIFLDRIGQESIHTRKTYERAIKDFFLVMRNRELHQLVEADLIFQKHQIKRYQINLRKQNKTMTVNTKIAALKKCYSEFEDFGFDVSQSWFDLTKYKEYDRTSYDPLTHEEMIEVLALVGKTRKGFEKGLLIRLAFATAFRRSSLLELKWTDIYSENGVWFVKALGKGNEWDTKKISNELYNDLMKQKELVGGTKIFRLQKKTIDKMMSYIRENMDFGERCITFHSFKKSSINEVALLTNYDVKAMQQQGNHASPTTAIKDYMSKKKKDEMVVVDIDFQVPIDRIEELSHEELIQLIKNTDRNTQIKLLQAAGLMK